MDQVISPAKTRSIQKNNNAGNTQNGPFCTKYPENAEKGLCEIFRKC
jgi:hypothetical protein